MLQLLKGDFAFQCSSTSRNCRNLDTELILCLFFLSFSALQRAEIAEICLRVCLRSVWLRFSALQRAEIAEMFGRVSTTHCNTMFQCSSTSRNCRNSKPLSPGGGPSTSFSALQRAEIAEMEFAKRHMVFRIRFSALQRAEIAEIEFLQEHLCE